MQVNPSLPAKTRSRVHRLCEGQSRQDRDGLRRQRFAGACHRGIFQADDRYRSHSCSLSRRGPRGDRSARRANPGGVHRIGNVARARQVRQSARAGGDDRTRAEALPDVPTLSEYIPGFEASQWVGLVAPKDTPPAIIEKLNSEINAALADPKLKARFADLGGVVLPGSPADFGKLIRDETEKWAKVIRAANIKAGADPVPRPSQRHAQLEWSVQQRIGAVIRAYEEQGSIAPGRRSIDISGDWLADEVRADRSRTRCARNSRSAGSIPVGASLVVNGRTIEGLPLFDGALHGSGRHRGRSRDPRQRGIDRAYRDCTERRGNRRLGRRAPAKPASGHRRRHPRGASRILPEQCR